MKARAAYSNTAGAFQNFRADNRTAYHSNKQSRTATAPPAEDIVDKESDDDSDGNADMNLGNFTVDDDDNEAPPESDKDLIDMVQNFVANMSNIQ